MPCVIWCLINLLSQNCGPCRTNNSVFGSCNWLWTVSLLSLDSHYCENGSLTNSDILLYNLSRMLYVVTRRNSTITKWRQRWPPKKKIELFLCRLCKRYKKYMLRTWSSHNILVYLRSWYPHLNAFNESGTVFFILVRHSAFGIIERVWIIWSRGEIMFCTKLSTVIISRLSWIMARILSFCRYNCCGWYWSCSIRSYAAT